MIISRHFNFAFFLLKIAFRGILISRLGQNSVFRGILILRFEGVFLKNTLYLCIFRGQKKKFSRLGQNSEFHCILISRLSSKFVFRGILLSRFFVLDRETAKFSCNKVILQNKKYKEKSVCDLTGQ